MFVDRVDEMAKLNQRYAAGKPELFVLYGKRRVGKTELLTQFCQGKRSVFFVATMSSDSEQLAAFSQAVWAFDHDTAPNGFTFPTWEAAFRALADLPGRLVVVIDEFTYLVGGNKAIPSILQMVWDQVLSRSKVFLVLCGSYIGMMEREVLNHQAPLYGRRTGGYLLSPLELPAAAEFFPCYTPTEQIEAWAVLGGMPYYLSVFADDVDLFTNIRDHILDSYGTLYREPLLLLMEELREPRNYFSILKAIANGKTRLTEISQAAGMGGVTTTARYLDILQEMRYVVRAVPATEPKPEKSKKGTYQIADPFLRFWFRYVYPNQGALDMGLADAVLENKVRPTFDQYMGYAFEQAAREHVVRMARAGELPFMPERVGAWWDRRDEIDVVAVSDAERTLLIGECKWSAHPVGMNVLGELKRRLARLKTSAGNEWAHVFLALFSKSGFTPELSAVAADEDVALVEAKDLLDGPA